ncbi:MAG: hypothetical protein H6Q99_55 [Proteobacteria bacterium]|nr:hypothetical protein [Pseudomonadota bacterium]
MIWDLQLAGILDGFDRKALAGGEPVWLGTARWPDFLFPELMGESPDLVVTVGFDCRFLSWLWRKRGEKARGPPEPKACGGRHRVAFRADLALDLAECVARVAGDGGSGRAVSIGSG